MKLKLKGALVGVSFLHPNGEQVELKFIIKRESKEDNLIHKLRVLIAKLGTISITLNDEE